MSGDLAWALRAVKDAPQGPRTAAFFDLDGTLVQGFTAVAFLRELIGRGDVPVSDIARLSAAGLAYARNPEEGLHIIQEAARLLKGRELETLREESRALFKKRIARTIRPQARQLVQAHHDAGHTLVVSSSATSFQVLPVADDLNIPHRLTTQLEVVDGVLTGELDGRPLWGPGKEQAVLAFAETHDIDLANSFAYGNGREDKRFLGTVGRPVAVSPDSGLRAHAEATGLPVLDLEEPVRAGRRAALRTLAGIGAFNAGLFSTLAVGPALGRREAFRLAAGPTADLCLAAVGVQVRTWGREHLDNRPAVFVFNHQSNLDPMVVGKLVRTDFTVVGKKELASDLRGAAIRFLDVALIDRSDSEAARASVAALVERIQGGESVLIAPEGTRMPTPKPGRFKRSAFHLAMDAQVPVVPIVLRNTGELWPRSALAIASGTVDVCVLPPIPTTGWVREDVGKHADALRDRIAQLIGHWPAASEADPA